MGLKKKPSDDKELSILLRNAGEKADVVKPTKPDPIKELFYEDDEFDEVSTVIPKLYYPEVYKPCKNCGTNNAPFLTSRHQVCLMCKAEQVKKNNKWQTMIFLARYHAGSTLAKIFPEIYRYLVMKELFRLGGSRKFDPFGEEGRKLVKEDQAKVLTEMLERAIMDREERRGTPSHGKGFTIFK